MTDKIDMAFVQQAFSRSNGAATKCQSMKCARRLFTMMIPVVAISGHRSAALLPRIAARFLTTQITPDGDRLPSVIWYDGRWIDGESSNSSRI